MIGLAYVVRDRRTGHYVTDNDGKIRVFDEYHVPTEEYPVFEQHVIGPRSADREARADGGGGYYVVDETDARVVAGPFDSRERARERVPDDRAHCYMVCDRGVIDMLEMASDRSVTWYTDDPELRSDGGEATCAKRSCKRTDTMGIADGRGSTSVRCYRHALEEVDGVGETTADRLLDAYGSVEQLYQTCAMYGGDHSLPGGPVGITNIDGFGPDRAGVVAERVAQMFDDEFDTDNDGGREVRADGGSEPPEDDVAPEDFDAGDVAILRNGKAARTLYSTTNELVAAVRDPACRGSRRDYICRGNRRVVVVEPEAVVDRVPRGSQSTMGHREDLRRLEDEYAPIVEDALSDGRDADNGGGRRG